jgi:hypothetical protein
MVAGDGAAVLAKYPSCDSHLVSIETGSQCGDHSLDIHTRSLGMPARYGDDIPTI